LSVWARVFAVFAPTGSSKPAADEPADKPAPASPGDAERWTTASSGVRTTAQWLATALGAIAGVIFGAGPLINNETDVSAWDARRWVLVLVAAAVGVLGVVAIVSRLVLAMMPCEVTLDGLPKALLSRIEASPADYLPVGITTVTDFRDRLSSFTRAAAQLEIAARREADPKKKSLLADRAKIQSANRDYFRTKRSDLYAQAKYYVESGRLGGAGNAAWFATAALAAVLGISCFTFLTHAPADDQKADTPAPQGALLIPKEGADDLWSALDLDKCAIGSEVGVPVLLLGTTGENGDHYQVQTLGQPTGCGRYSFTVSDGMVDVVVPVSIEVTFSEPTPSAS
jgi:hypothetical protein